MENISALQKLLSELSNKNELLSKENNDLNVKILSLTRIIQVKDEQINCLNKQLKNKQIKNIFYKKLFKETKNLENAFYNLKYYKQKKYLQPKLFYGNEIYFYILNQKENNSAEKGVGDFNIHRRLFIRREACLTLLRKRKKNNNINNNDKSIIDQSICTKNFEYNYIINNKVNNIFIESKINKNFFENKKLKENQISNFIILNNNNTKDIFKIAQLNKFEFIGNNDNKQNQDLKIIKANKFQYKTKKIPKILLISKVIHNLSIISSDNKRLNENEEEEENDYNSIVDENEKLKQEIMIKNKDIENINFLHKNDENQIIELNKNIEVLQKELLICKNENEKYKKLGERMIKIDEYFTNQKLQIQIFKNNSDSFSIFSNKEIKNNIILKHDDLDIKLEMIKESDICLLNKTNFRKEFVSNFEEALLAIEKKNNSFKILVFESKLNNVTSHIKYSIFQKLSHFYFINKINNTFDICRNLLITNKLKFLLINKIYTLNYFFNKYRSRILIQSNKYINKEFQNQLNTNKTLENKLNLFTNTFKQYQDKRDREDDQKNIEIDNNKNIVKSLNNDLLGQKSEIEKIKRTAKESTEELIICTNKCNDQGKKINFLNNEISELKEQKLFLDNKILTQQELIKNLNEKMQEYQNENEQNEDNMNKHISKVKIQFDEYESSIMNLNKQNKHLLKENDKLQTTNENINKKNEQLLEIVKNSQNLEIENDKLSNENEQLKFNYEIVNQKYINLKEDFDNLKILSEESKNELNKALSEMELYSNLLQTLENKYKQAENDKILAQNERDKAINDVKKIRQRYINIMGGDNF